MIKIALEESEIEKEIDRIIHFLKLNIADGRAVVGVSGGLDSDVVARLLGRVLSPKNMKLFIVLQDNFEYKYIKNAENLAKDLNVELHKIDFHGFPLEFIKKMKNADSTENFMPEGFLDVSRANCSLRTAIFSTYQDRGHMVVGTSNRTELETGFFLPFGDGIAHLKPIVHLYKTQVRQIAVNIGSRQEVLDQPASAAFWENENDLEDLSFWLCNGGPIMQQKKWSEEELYLAEKIESELTTEKIDMAISGIVDLKKNNEEISKQVGISPETIERFRVLIQESYKFKRRPYNICVSD